ncbi:MAG: Sec-independent protein translocase protein TatB [Alphaproteobacteria bacterium]
MFDIGGWEFLLIIMLALLIIGPKDLPLAIRTITQWIRKARSLAQEFQYNLDDIATQAEIDKVKTDLVADTGFSDMKTEIEETLKAEIDPQGNLDASIQSFRNSVDNQEFLEIDSSEENMSSETNSSEEAGLKDVDFDSTGKSNS